MSNRPETNSSCFFYLAGYNLGIKINYILAYSYCNGFETLPKIPCIVRNEHMPNGTKGECTSDNISGGHDEHTETNVHVERVCSAP